MHVLYLITACWSLSPVAALRRPSPPPFGTVDATPVPTPGLLGSQRYAPDPFHALTPWPRPHEPGARLLLFQETEGDCTPQAWAFSPEHMAWRDLHVEAAGAPLPVVTWVVYVDLPEVWDPSFSVFCVCRERPTGFARFNLSQLTLTGAGPAGSACVDAWVSVIRREDAPCVGGTAALHVSTGGGGIALWVQYPDDRGQPESMLWVEGAETSVFEHPYQQPSSGEPARWLLRPLNASCHTLALELPPHEDCKHPKPFSWYTGIDKALPVWTMVAWIVVLGGFGFFIGSGAWKDKPDTTILFISLLLALHIPLEADMTFRAYCIATFVGISLPVAAAVATTLYGLCRDSRYRRLFGGRGQGLGHCFVFTSIYGMVVAAALAMKS